MKEQNFLSRLFKYFGSNEETNTKRLPKDYFDIYDNFYDLSIFIYKNNGFVLKEVVSLGDEIKEDIPFVGLDKGDFWLIRNDDSQIGAKVKNCFLYGRELCWIYKENKTKVKRKDKVY